MCLIPHEAMKHLNSLLLGYLLNLVVVAAAAVVVVFAAAVVVAAVADNAAG